MNEENFGMESILKLISEWNGKKLPDTCTGFDFHHYGLACRDINNTSLLLKQIGYSIGPVVYDPLQKVVLSICRHQFLPCIEIISSDSDDNPIKRIIENNEMCIYHICYVIKECNEALKKLSNLGYRYFTVSNPKEAVLFYGDLVSFHFIKEFGLIELLEKKNYEE
jgi:hypothetical protein